MWANLSPTLLGLWILATTCAATELNLYISKEHISTYYNHSIDNKVVVVHKRDNLVGANDRLMFNNGTLLPPLPHSVDKVTFTWLATEKEEVMYNIELQEDPVQPSILMKPTISIVGIGRVPVNRSSFDVSLICASVTLGIGRVGVNLSLHYANDGFNLSVFFLIEKHCTVGANQSDMVQPTEVAVGEKMNATEGSGVDGSGKISLTDLDVLSPTTTVVTVSSQGNVIMNTSSYTVTSTVKLDQSDTSILVSSSLANQSSSVQLQPNNISSTLIVQTTKSSFSFSSPTAVSTTSQAIDSTILSPSSLNDVGSGLTTSVSSVFSSADDSGSGFATADVTTTSSIPSSSSVLQYSTTPVTSLYESVSSVPVGVKETSVVSSDTVSSATAVDVLSSSLSSSTGFTSSTGLTSSLETSLAGSVMSSSVIVSSQSVLISETVINQTSQSDHSTSIQISSTAVPIVTTTSFRTAVTSLYPSMSSIPVGVKETSVVSSDIVSSDIVSSATAVGVLSSSLSSSTGFASSTGLTGSSETSLAASVISNSVIVSSQSILTTETVVNQTSQSDHSTSIQISSPAVPIVTSTSYRPAVTSSVQSSVVDAMTTFMFSSTTSSFASPTTTDDPLSTLSVSVVSSSSMTSSAAVTMVTTSSTTEPATSAVIPTPVTSSSEDTKSSTNTFMTPSFSDFSISSSTISTIAAGTSSKMSSFSSSSSSSSEAVSTLTPSSTSKTTTSISIMASSVIPTVIVSEPHDTSSSPMTTELVTSSTSVAIEATVTVGVTATSETDEASLTLIIIVAATTSALITVCIMLICVVMAMMFRQRRKPRRRRSPIDNGIRIEFNSPMHADKYKEEDNFGPPSACTSLRWGSIRNLTRHSQKLVEQLTVDRDTIEMVETIKKGEYGWLIKGKVMMEADSDTEVDINADTLPTHQLVLAKMITGLGLGTKACGSCEEVSEFLDQATLLRGISHPNILAVLGLCSDDHQAPIVMYSYPAIGNLHTFLTTHKQASSATRQKGPVTPKLLMDLCVQLAEAMKHLECFRIIHPDLQLRSCYLDAGYTLKLGDGAVMSDFYPECYHVVYGAQRPVRWSALETLQGGLCTLPSNVWSFGITIWEIITMGDFPYSEVTNRNVLAHVMLGSRLEQPHDCPNELYELMCNCWHTSPKQRPMFLEIVNDLKSLSRLYSSDEEPGTFSSDSAFFLKQQQRMQPPTQAFHYNDKDMSYLLTAPITAADAVSLTFSALGSTEDLDQTGKGCMVGDNRQQDARSSVGIETSSSICSPEEALSPIPHINIAPPDMPYGNTQQSVVPSRIPLRNEPPVNKFLLKANGSSRESTPDYRYSMSSDSQYSSSQFSSDVSDNSRQHLLRHKRDSPEKRTSAIAEQSYKEEKDFASNSNHNNAVPSLEGEMLSELMVSFDQRLTNSSHHQ